MELILIISISYLMGSIPFGLILTKFFLKKDIREVGSGNIGATNVLRTGNKTIGYLTLLLDVLKAVTPVLYIKFKFPELVYISSLSVFIGHVFPIWLKFKGGKGVATYLGILLALSIQLSLLFMFTWLVISLIFRYSSLSSMFAALTVFIVSSLREIANPIILSMSEKSLNTNEISSDLSFILFIFFILIIFTHRKNISNLKNKTETKIKI